MPSETADSEPVLRKVRVLIRTCSGFGLGDIVQASIVLKHLARYRPNWLVDMLVPRGTGSGLRHLCNAVHESEPDLSGYDSVFDWHLTETYPQAFDRPLTKHAYALQHTFLIPEYDQDLSRAECLVSPRALHRARRWCRLTFPSANGDNWPIVLVHYRGGSSGHRKDLQDWQALEICDLIKQAGRTPVLLDWSKKCPFLASVIKPFDELWGVPGAGDAEVIGGLVMCAEAYIGIDSGPAKIASTTDTPALICWTKNHPLRYHDPADNTTHLVPQDWSQAEPICGDERLIKFFQSFYRFREYSAEHQLVSRVAEWLAFTLDTPLTALGITFVIPPGLRSLAWCVAKMRQLAGQRPIEVVVSGNWRRKKDSVSLPILKAIPWIRSVSLEDVPIHRGPEKEKDVLGRHLFISEGPQNGRYYLIPDVIFERKGTIYDWIPSVGIDEDAVNWLKEKCDLAPE